MNPPDPHDKGPLYLRWETSMVTSRAGSSVPAADVHGSPRTAAVEPEQIPKR
jgi:hypothetical protein